MYDLVIRRGLSSRQDVDELLGSDGPDVGGADAGADNKLDFVGVALRRRRNALPVFFAWQLAPEGAGLKLRLTGRLPGPELRSDRQPSHALRVRLHVQRHEYNLHKRIDPKLKEAGLLEPPKDAKTPERYAPLNE